MRALAIDVVSDVICPWCFIGTRRLDQALASMPDVDATVTYRPFLLDPTTPPEGADLRARLRAKYGVAPESMFARVEEAARASGIPLDFAKVQRTPNTTAAHTLLRHALETGTQRALAGALFAAYFLEGRDIGDVEVLAAIGAAHGLDASRTGAILSDSAELTRTRDEAASMVEDGIRGVPFTIFDGRLSVSGAQPTEVFATAIQRALA